MRFKFSGALPASKSVLNRHLIIQSFAPSLNVIGDSSCDDVLMMKRALPKILAGRGEPADCGAAGTTFRFLALRALRIPGRHLLIGSPRLLARPQGPLLELIHQLGGRAELSSQGLIIESEGWQKPSQPIRVDRSQSSQFASALLLSAWELDFDLPLHWDVGDGPSEGYFEMTREIVEQAGMQLQVSDDSLVIKSGAIVTIKMVEAEPDVSSAFAIAAIGALAGQVEITNFPCHHSLQPDAIFPSILRAMGAEVECRSQHLSVGKTEHLMPIDCNLKNAPDLFPVLAVLCAFAEGKSQLSGAHHLAYKESNRIETTAELLQKLACPITIQSDGLIIDGPVSSPVAFVFNPQDDHRLAMAAALANVGGAQIQLMHPEVVNKSFPEFWQIYRDGLNLGSL